MSVVKHSKYGWLISHENLIKEIYKEVDAVHASYQLKSELFKIITAYKTAKFIKRKSLDNSSQDPFETEVRHVEELYKCFYKEVCEIFEKPGLEVKNNEALNVAAEIYAESEQKLVKNTYGFNTDTAITKSVNNATFLFPENSRFYSKDILEIDDHLKGEKFDLILLDPPWWNKYIRRKRKRSDDGYSMLYNEQLKNLPLENYLTENGLVVVWCTNSLQHLKALQDDIFPKWGVKYLGKWYWIKVTKSGEVVCPFSKPPQKQPFEQIIFGVCKSRSLPNPPCDKLVVSVPSALHSHKPPLIRLLEPFLPLAPACLELFARYLLPHWTSYGNEVLRLQHECLYTKLGD